MTARERLASRVGRQLHRAAHVVRAGGRGQPDTDGPLRVAVLSDAFIRYGSAQAIGLKAAGAEVTFYYVDRLGEFGGSAEDRQPFLDRVQDAGIPTCPLPQRELRRMWRQVSTLHRDLRRRRVEALIVHAHIDPRYATLGLRFPVALFIHDPRPHSGDYASAYPAPVRAMARFAEATSSCLLLHSQRLTSELYPMLRALPTGIVQHGAQVSDAVPPLSDPPSLAVVGRLMEYKGVDTALDAFRLVREQRPDAVMVVAGKGRMGAQIAAASPAGVDLRDRYIPEPELDAILDSARLVLLPYKDATQSGVGLLAAARGIPCIVSDVGALPDLVPPGQDWIVPPGDPRALAGVILRAIDHDERTRQEVLTFAREHLDWPVVCGHLLAELQQLGVVRARSEQLRPDTDKR